MVGRVEIESSNNGLLVLPIGLRKCIVRKTKAFSHIRTNQGAASRYAVDTSLTLFRPAPRGVCTREKCIFMRDGRRQHAVEMNHSEAAARRYPQSAISGRRRVASLPNRHCSTWPRATSNARRTRAIRDGGAPWSKVAKQCACGRGCWRPPMRDSTASSTDTVAGVSRSSPTRLAMCGASEPTRMLRPHAASEMPTRPSPRRSRHRAHLALAVQGRS